MGSREGSDIMINDLNKTVAAILSTNGLLGWLLQFNTPVGDMLWLEGDTSFVKTEIDE